MPRPFVTRTLGVLTTLTVVLATSPAAHAAAPGPPAAGATAPAALPATTLLAQSDDEPIEAAEDLTGDIEFSVPGGTFQGQLSVSLDTDVPDAEIRYTTDGEPPTASSPVFDGTPIQLTSTTQLRAQPFADGEPAGDLGTAVYVAHNVTTSHDLPVLMIDSYGQGLPDREDYDSATLFFEPTDGVTSLDDPAFATRAGFHLRGQSSATFDKTPYRIEFWENEDGDDADYPVMDMPADSDWVLRGPFTDKALIREALVFDLGREMGLFAPRYEFIEFYVNGDDAPVGDEDYMGVYMLMENIKNTKVRLDLRQLREDDTTLPDIEGGYIWKFDWLAAEEPMLECPGDPATCWSYLEMVDPDPPNAEQEQWITGHLNEFNDVLHSPNFADPVTGYPAYIEVESWVDHLIINELSREMDSYVRSAYFYKDHDTKIFAGPLWDYDLTFGVGGAFQNDQTAGWQYEQTRQPVANDWFQRVLEDPAFVERVRARWQELRSGMLSDAALTARIDELTGPLTAAADRNFQRWPNLTQQMISFFTTSTAPTWQGQVDVMRDWLLERAAWLDSPAGWDVNAPATPPTTSPPTTSPPTTTPPTTSPPTSTPPTTTPPAPAGCTAEYTVVNEWPGGFQGEVVVTAGDAPVNGWTVSWTFPDGQSVNQAWGAVVSGASQVTASNEAWNGALDAGASTSFGFIGSWNGANGVPTLTCTTS